MAAETFGRMEKSVEGERSHQKYFLVDPRYQCSERGVPERPAFGESVHDCARSPTAQSW